MPNNWHTPSNYEDYGHNNFWVDINFPFLKSIPLMEPNTSTQVWLVCTREILPLDSDQPQSLYTIILRLCNLYTLPDLYDNNLFPVYLSYSSLNPVEILVSA